MKAQKINFKKGNRYANNQLKKLLKMMKCLKPLLVIGLMKLILC